MGDREREGGRLMRVVFSVLLLTLCFIVTHPAPARVLTGADVLVEKRLDLLSGKRVALVTNHTGRLSNGEFTVDVLVKRGVRVVRLFSPEHGIRGRVVAGESVVDSVDARSGIPVVSLYGKIEKPTPAMLADIDVIVYDIQDVGARFYTYISTMKLCMEAAAENGLEFLLLDRPNPLGGLKVDGPIMEDSLRSFVGMLPIPVVYGLTCGELAGMINGERWLSGGLRAKLTVVSMEGWKRSMLWEATGLPWVPPSPNIPFPGSALIYPATCYIEGTNLSEGRGTPRPFETVGAPFLDGGRLSSALNALKLKGVKISPTSFTPRSSKFKGDSCQGILLEVTDGAAFEPLRTALSLLKTAQSSSSENFTVNRHGFLRLMGSSRVYDMLRRGENVGKMIGSWKKQTKAFERESRSYFLYPAN
jgi:uncharacterized protein YbbC (DUF1343 family)